VSSYGDHPLLQPAAAQLANAMVAVLGPQFTLGSMAYSRCKTLVTDNTGEFVRALGWLAGWLLGGWVASVVPCWCWCSSNPHSCNNTHIPAITAAFSSSGAKSLVLLLSSIP
jgi:hypothetical protein